MPHRSRKTGRPAARHPLAAWLTSAAGHSVAVLALLLVVRPGTLRDAVAPGGWLRARLLESATPAEPEDPGPPPVVAPAPVETPPDGAADPEPAPPPPMPSPQTPTPNAASDPQADASAPSGEGPPGRLAFAAARAAATSGAARFLPSAPPAPGASVGRVGVLGRLDRAARGGGARVQIFGVEGVGKRFVFAFDHSASMSGAPLAAAKRQLLAGLDALGPSHQFQIVFFNHRTTSFDLTGGQRRVPFATDATREAAGRFVDGVSADGGTDRFAALRLAISLGPDVLFFLTDADDAMTSRELSEVVALNERHGAAICSIEFGRGPDPRRENFLVELARRSGGDYGYVDTTRLAR